MVTTFEYFDEKKNLINESYTSNSTSYEIDKQNFLTFSTRRNREIKLTEYYNLIYEYKNDCLTAGIQFNKTYYEDRDLKPSENLFFTISIIPITTYERSLYKR